jgi:hypothetical protein
LTIFNQRTTSNFERISVLVNRPNIAVTTFDGIQIKAETFPYIDLSSWTQNEAIFEVNIYKNVKVPNF